MNVGCLPPFCVSSPPSLWSGSSTTVRRPSWYLSGTDQFKERKTFPYPDLVLLDYRMPKCTGVEVLAHFHDRLRLPSVVLWSNTLEQLDVATALELGADVVCKKPSNLQEFAHIINRVAAKTSYKVPLVHDLNPDVAGIYHQSHGKTTARRHKLYS